MSLSDPYAAGPGAEITNKEAWLRSTMNETGREYLKRVALASFFVKRHGEDDSDMLNMLGIGDGPKFSNKPTSRNMRSVSGISRGPTEVPAIIRNVRLQALQMDGLAAPTNSGTVEA